MKIPKNTQFLLAQVLKGLSLNKTAKEIHSEINAANGPNDQISYSVIIKIIV
jgi:hypothetical protein